MSRNRKKLIAHAHILPLPMPENVWHKIAAPLKLSPQQLSITELILRGLQDKQIAECLGIKKPTVRTQLDRIKTRIGVGDRMELVLRLFAASHGIDHNPQHQ
jgi:DNA-binding NarL/FixJ family response regulator